MMKFQLFNKLEQNWKIRLKKLVCYQKFSEQNQKINLLNKKLLLTGSVQDCLRNGEFLGICHWIGVERSFN